MVDPRWTREHLQRVKGAAWWMHDTVADAVKHASVFTLLDHGAEAAHLLAYALGTYWWALVQAGLDVGYPVPPEPDDVRLVRDVAAHLDEYVRGLGAYQPGGRRRTRLAAGACVLTFAQTDPADAPAVVLRVVPIPESHATAVAEYLPGPLPRGYVEVDVTRELRTLDDPSAEVMRRLTAEVGDDWWHGSDDD